MNGVRRAAGVGANVVASPEGAAVSNPNIIFRLSKSSRQRYSRYKFKVEPSWLENVLVNYCNNSKLVICTPSVELLLDRLEDCWLSGSSGAYCYWDGHTIVKRQDDKYLFVIIPGVEHVKKFANTQMMGQGAVGVIQCGKETVGLVQDLVECQAEVIYDTFEWHHLTEESWQDLLNSYVLVRGQKCKFKEAARDIFTINVNLSMELILANGVELVEIYKNNFDREQVTTGKESPSTAGNSGETQNFNQNVVREGAGVGASVIPSLASCTNTIFHLSQSSRIRHSKYKFANEPKWLIDASLYNSSRLVICTQSVELLLDRLEDCGAYCFWDGHTKIKYEPKEYLFVIIPGVEHLKTFVDAQMGERIFGVIQCDKEEVGMVKELVGCQAEVIFDTFSWYDLKKESREKLLNSNVSVGGEKCTFADAFSHGFHCGMIDPNLIMELIQANGVECVELFKTTLSDKK